MDSAPALIVVGWIVLHSAAIALAWLTRISDRSRLGPLVQAAFFVAMTAVALAIWFSHQHNDNVWLASAITLIAMVVTAVVDCQRVNDPWRTTAEAPGR
jgi:hypothetical protein